MTRRVGATIVELMVVLLVAGMIAAGISTVLRRQQRFFTNAATVIAQRVSLRDATAMLPGEVRALSSAGGDVIAFSDSALEIKATIGVAVACDTVAGGAAIDIAAAGDASSGLLAAFSMPAQPGDVALVYDAGPTDADGDDRWEPHEISSVSQPAGACTASALMPTTAAPNAAATRLRFIGGAPMAPSVRPGAFVRVQRRIRYRLYRAGTGAWYLGYTEWDGTGFGVVQPVSGPFAAYARPSSGFALQYFDDADTPLTSPSDAARLARVELAVRGSPGAGLSGNQSSYTDSQAVAVGLRNR